MQPGYPGQDDPQGQQPPQYGQQPPQYGQQPPQYGQQPPQSYPSAPGYPAGAYPAGGQGQNNTMGLASMIMGIAAIPLLCCFYIGLPLGIAAAVMGFLAKKKADQGLASNRSQAMTGLITGAIAAVLGIVLILLSVVFQVMDLPTNYNYSN